MLKSGEKLENLGGGMRAIVSPEHGFGVDAILLAYFSNPKEGWKVCDLGTGCGIIPLLWCRRGAPFEIDAFEIREEAADMARRAAELCGVSIHVSCTDFRRLGSSFAGKYDLVACNPPYFPLGSARQSAYPAKKTARHESCCSLDDVAAVSARLLKFGGRLCLCHRPERIAEIMERLRAHSIEPKRMRFVQQKSDSGPWLVLLEGRRGGRPGLTVLPTLVMEVNGEVSLEMREIYGDYQSDNFN